MDLEDLLDIGKILIVALIIVSTFIGILIIPAVFIDKVSCKNSYSEYNPQWSFWGGCKIDYNGKLTPVDMIKNINVK